VFCSCWAVAAGGETRWEQAGRHLDQARALVEEADEAGLLARVDAQAAEVALGLRQPEAAAALARHALERARAGDLPEVACAALEVIGRCARMHDLAAARAAFGQAATLAARHDHTLWRLRALHELGTIDLLATNGTERLLEARALAERAGAPAMAATLDIQLASAYYGAFEPDRVLEVATRAEGAARRFRLDLVLPMALLWQAAGYAQRGERDAMEAKIAEALALAGEDPDAAGMAWGWCRAVSSLLDGDRAGAATQLDLAVDFLKRSPAMNPWGFRGLWALLRTLNGQDGAAACQAAREAGVAVFWMNRGYLAYAEAVTRGRLGDVDGARATFAEGEAALSASDWFRHLARLLVAEAAIVGGWGDPLAWLREGEVFFEERGHVHVASGCRSLLRQAGAPLPRKGRGESVVPHPLRALGVTSREMDVLRLVAERLGNKEIAHRLYLSPRTVEKHVACLIAKTEVGDRRELQTVARAYLDPGASTR
jgi:DNA-binding CsgD family transcriptional regulator